MFYGRYKHEDPKNTEKKRNTKNSYKGEYNCAGYALGCFSWYCPFNYHEPDVEENVTKILQDFGNVRVVRSEKELEDNEYLIAFRTNYRDFHFMKKAKNGHWYEKQGGHPSIFNVKEEEVFSKAWCSYRSDGGYTSRITLFAVKE